MFTVTGCKIFIFRLLCTLRGDVFYRSTLRQDVFLVVCQVLCAKMVGATSSESCLVASLPFSQLA